MKKKNNYVPTSLDQYLTENKSITLTRQYGDKEAVVVGSRAPLRNQVLAFVMENAKVTRATLKKFISGLNEGGSTPAATNMWLKRNAKFFIVESKNGMTTYKLSKIGEKLATTIQPVQAVSEEKKEKYGKEDKGEEKIEEDDDAEMEAEGCSVKESREERISKLVEQIRAKRAKKVNEEEMMAEDGEDEPDLDDAEDAAEDAVEDAVEDVEDAADNAEEATDDLDLDDEAPVEEDDRVEIAEFIITVDDVASAIEELGELGIDASEVGMETDVEDDLVDLDGPDPTLDEVPVEDDELAPVEGGEDDLEMDDFDLDLEGDIEGEVEESITGMEDFEKSRNAKYAASPPNLTEDDEDAADELAMGDLDELPVEDEVAPAEVAGEEEELVDLDDEVPAEDDLESIDDLEAPEGEENQIRVSAENWEQLKGWLEDKGVDTEEMFGGNIEVEGEDVEDEISFDGLEDIEGDEAPAAEAEEGEEKGDEDDLADDLEDDDKEEVEESVTGMENFEKKRDKEAGDKPANTTKTKNTKTKKVNK